MSQNEAIRLLLINDKESEVERLVSMLRNSGRPSRAQHVPNEEGLVKLLSDQVWDMLIAIQPSTSCDGIAAIRQIKKLDKDVPVILMIDPEDDAERQMQLIEGLKAGARDVTILDDDQHLLLVIARELQNLNDRRQRRLTDRKFKEAERRNQQLLNSSKDAIAFVEDGLFVYANESFAERFGYADCDSVMAVTAIDLIAGKDQAAYKTFMKNFDLAEEPGTQELSLHCVREDGAEISVTIDVSRGTHEDQICTQFFIPALSGDTAALEAELGKARNIDTLSGLYNRQYMLDVLGTAVKNAAENSKSSALLYVNLDRFAINRKELGIAGSDALVSATGALLKAVAKPEYTLGRFREEGFLILVPSTDVEKLLALAAEVCSKVEGHIFSADGKTVQCTVSVGVAIINENATDPDEIIERGTKASEEVRDAQGVGNKAKVFELKLSESDSLKQQIPELVKNALEKEQLELYYQPVVSLQGDEREHYEVFLRLWLPTDDGTTKELKPAEVFQNINKDLATKLDRWVILHAAKALAEQQTKKPNTRMFINLSSASFQDDTLTPWLGVAFKAAGIKPSDMLFVVTESDVTSYLNHAKAFSDGLKTLGSSCAVKNFGCGLNPFNIFKHLAPEMVKIDGSFTANLQSKSDNPDVLKKLIKELSEQEMKCIVPHVETAVILSTLWQAGAHYIQGKYMQAPAPMMVFDFNSD